MAFFSGSAVDSGAPSCLARQHQQAAHSLGVGGNDVLVRVAADRASFEHCRHPRRATHGHRTRKHSAGRWHHHREPRARWSSVTINKSTIKNYQEDIRVRVLYFYILYFQEVERAPTPKHIREAQEILEERTPEVKVDKHALERLLYKVCTVHDWLIVHVFRNLRSLHDSVNLRYFCLQVVEATEGCKLQDLERLHCSFSQTIFHHRNEHDKTQLVRELQRSVAKLNWVSLLFSSPLYFYTVDTYCMSNIQF